MKKILMSLLVIALVAVGVAGATGAYFSDETKANITTGNADVEIGALTGFPLSFDNLTPDVWTDWKEVSITSASTIPMDVYIGMQSRGLEGETDLSDVLYIQIQQWDGASWGIVYNAKAVGLFTDWQNIARDMPVGTTGYYRVRVQLSADAGNELERAWTNAWVLIYGAQYNGPVPTGQPFNYTPLP